VKLSWQQIPSPMVSDILSEYCDGTVIDTEHGCFNNETLYNCIQVIKLKKKRCFVRLKDISKSMIGMCLDAGADGLIFSTIETGEQCEKIIEYSRFPPHGKRGLGLVKQNQWAMEYTRYSLVKDGHGDYYKVAPPILIPQIETKEGVDMLEIIKTFDFDYYLIGPYDLSMSLNIAGQFDNPLYRSYIEKVEKIIPLKKRAIHIPKNIESVYLEYYYYGIVCVGMDTTALLTWQKEKF